MTDDDALDRLCEQWDVDTGYADIWGNWHAASDATKRALLEAMGACSAKDSHRQPILPRVQVLRQGAPLELVATFDPAIVSLPLRFRLVLESQQVIEGECALTPIDVDAAGRGLYRIRLPAALPLGYHELELLTRERIGVGDTRIIVAPSRCYPGSDQAPGRMFGPAVQVYALRSGRNWGIGDFTDLGVLVEIAAAHGADLVGVNPLHALFPDRPADASPYSPSNRSMLNALYIDVEAIEDFADCESARKVVASASFQQRIAEARSNPLVDYATVSALKHEILELVYPAFRSRHLDAATPRGLAFRAFQQRGGDGLLHHALHQALAQWLHARDPACWGTPQWPPEYRDSASVAVAEFLETQRDRVEFFAYLQWQARLQLAQVASRARRAGMAIGLYRDLAVGVNAYGSETWRNPSLFAEGIHVGAPPDEFNQKGQDWGLPPWIPRRVAHDHYEPWIDVLRANMSCAGALRIDHVMGLMRLYWVPAAADARDGTYVRYPFDAMLGVLALESERARCVVVGEDLGTVPDAVRDAMARVGILSYRVLLFQHTSDGRFAPPDAYPRDALCTFSTHDLPTLHGFLVEADLEARDALDLFPSESMRTQQYALRSEDRRRLRAALRDAGLLGNHAAHADADALQFDQALCNAVHAFLARTPSRLMTFQLEDVFGVVEQANMPSTTGERYPNWRRKVPVPLEEWVRDGRFVAACEAIRAQGRGASSATGQATAPA